VTRPAVETAAAIFRHRSIARTPVLPDDMGMPEPRIKRYALVPRAEEGGVRRFQLARVTSVSGSVPAAERLERMEEIAARERDGPARENDRRRA
jgi:hypothetical protein